MRAGGVLGVYSCVGSTCSIEQFLRALSTLGDVDNTTAWLGVSVCPTQQRSRKTQ